MSQMNSIMQCNKDKSIQKWNQKKGMCDLSNWRKKSKERQLQQA